MRIIKFRGKSIDGKEWLYGDLVRSSDMERCAILVSDRLSYDECEVNSCSVGQFTGLYDKNGNEIYEGDIVTFDDTPYCVNGSRYQGTVVMHNGAWCVKHYEKYFDVDFYSPLFADDFANRKTIILGNIHDNPELLEGGEK